MEKLRKVGNPGKILLYFAALQILANFVTPLGALAQLPITYFLKDVLKLGAKEVASFQLWMFAPVYIAFLFGMVRDRWSPLGLKDRGFFLIFAPIAAAGYVFLAFRHHTAGELISGALIVMVVYRLLGPSVVGLSAVVAKKLSMTGWLSALVQFVGTLIGACLSVLAGWLKENLTYEAIFLLLAGFSLCLFGLALLRPKAVFDVAEADPEPKRSLLEDIGHLVCHKPLIPALVISMIWAFGPGQDTPLFFHLTNTLKLTPSQVGLYNAIGNLTWVPGLLLFALLCKRVAPVKLLFWATVFAVPQMLALNYIHSVASAYLASAFVGMVGGMAATAYYDLLLRSCPAGFEGTTLELSMTLGIIVGKVGNLYGAQWYEHSGFAFCNWITAAAYALILPMILLVPKQVLARKEGEFQTSGE